MFKWLTYITDMLGRWDLHRDPRKPCVVRDEDRLRYGVRRAFLTSSEDTGIVRDLPFPGYHEIPEDIRLMAKWNPGELEVLAGKVLDKVSASVMAAEYQRGRADERARCAAIVDGIHMHRTADRIRSGE